MTPFGRSEDGWEPVPRRAYFDSEVGRPGVEISDIEARVSVPVEIAQAQGLRVIAEASKDITSHLLSGHAQNVLASNRADRFGWLSASSAPRLSCRISPNKGEEGLEQPLAPLLHPHSGLSLPGTQKAPKEINGRMATRVAEHRRNKGNSRTAKGPAPVGPNLRRCTIGYHPGPDSGPERY